MSENLVSRARLLIGQRRYEEANQVLSELLGQHPNNSSILAMSSEVALELKQTKRAEELITSALAIDPDAPYLYYIQSNVMLHLKKYDAAEKALEQATILDPEDADYFALWASVKLVRKQFKDALRLADQALELDPENLMGLNARSTALLKLDKKEDSFKTIEGALREDPNNAYTHSNYGWSLLEKGDHKKALEHFKEALSNDPNLGMAQAGMMEALKAKYIIYRLFLKYSFWMSNLTAKYQWGVIIGFYLAFRGLRMLAQSNETLQPYLTPILFILGLIAFSTWVMTPLSNLFLRLNKFGKHLLQKHELQSANFVGLSAATMLVGVVLFLIQGEIQWLTIAAYGFVMMVPFSVMFSPSKYKGALLIYSIAMAAVGLMAITAAITTGDIFNLFSMIFLGGFFLFQWIANFLLIKEDNA